ncbi:hypothetical protein K8T06_17360, partial [bacterium]|nr:hypothetical protein [bacterium]
TGEETQFRNLKGPFSVLPRIKYIVRVFLLAVIFVLVFAALVLLLRRLRKKNNEVAAEANEPCRPAHEIAMERLKLLQASKHLVQGNLRQYFIELSDILKEYIGKRYAFQAIEHTTGEIRYDITKFRMEQMIQTDIIAVLEQADVVKFACNLPSDDLCRDLLIRVEKIVQKTHERPILDPEEELVKTGDV